MKTMTIVLDLTDLYTEYNYDEEEPESIAELLTNEVKGRVLEELGNKLRDNVSKQVLERAEELIRESSFEEKILERMERNLDSLKLGNRYFREKKTLDKVIAEGMDNIVKRWTKDRMVEGRVKAAMGALEKSYNEQFAIAVLKKLKEADMLTEQAKGLLLANTSEEETLPTE